MEYIEKVLKYLDKNKIYPEILTIDGCPTKTVFSKNGKKIISFCSNDYLGLANSEILKNAARKAIDKYGIGSGGSRLISGNTDIQIELERKIADFKDQEDAITFTTGYMANSGVIPAIINVTRFLPSMSKKNVIFSDELNHASIVDGCRLSYAEIVKYKHGDINDLEDKIKKYKEFRKMIVTDGVFSMDGDIAPVPDIVKLAKKYKAIVMVDDAHGSGVLGKNGKGVIDYFNLNPGDVQVVMGTFTKAFGGIGGFIAGSKELIRYLRVSARTYIFTAPIPPIICASLIASIGEAEKNDKLRKKLWENADYLKLNLKNVGLNTMSSESQIIPILVGNEKRCDELSKKLLESGLFVASVKWPAVPKGMARLRVTVKSDHTKEQLDYFIDTIKKISKNLKII
jgi:8-amino-7-oxononanoate synthase